MAKSLLAALFLVWLASLDLVLECRGRLADVDYRYVTPQQVRELLEERYANWSMSYD